MYDISFFHWASDYLAIDDGVVLRGIEVEWIGNIGFDLFDKFIKSDFNEPCRLFFDDLCREILEVKHSANSNIEVHERILIGILFIVVDSRDKLFDDWMRGIQLNVLHAWFDQSHK